MIKVPVSWKIVPIISPMNTSEVEPALVNSIKFSHLKTPAIDNVLKKCDNKISSKKFIFKEPIKRSPNNASKLAIEKYKTVRSNTALSIDEKTSSFSTVQNSKLNHLKSKNMCSSKSPTTVGWKINSPKSLILEDVIKTNNFNITKFSQVISSDSGDSCLDSVTLTYPISEVNDKNDIVIDSGYNIEKNAVLESSIGSTPSENDQLREYISVVEPSEPSCEQSDLHNRIMNTNPENIKPPEQFILNPKKKLIERAKHSMNNSNEIFSDNKTQSDSTPSDQKEDIDNNNIKPMNILSHQSDKNLTEQNESKVRKVYNHLSNIKTNSTEASNTVINSLSSNVKNSLFAHGKNNKTKNNVKSPTLSANNKATKYRKYSKKDIVNLRRKMKSPPIPESIKNMRIKEVYPDHWNCVYCSKEITYNDIYEHSTTCIHTDTDEYGKHLSCCICKYATMKLSNLRKHIWTHTGEKPFKCYKCSYNSTQSSNLRMHLKIKHGMVNIIN